MNLKNKSIAIIGTNGLPGRYGGWDQLLNHLTSGLSNKYEIGVYTSTYNQVKPEKVINGSRIILIPFKANGFQSVIYDTVSMIHALFKYDILLILGTSGCIFLPIIRIFHSKVYLNPDGAEWKRGKWNKIVQLFLKFSEYCGIKFATTIISDNLIIQQYIQDEYRKKSILIEYGGDNAEFVTLSSSTKGKYSISEKTYAFKVCRIEPENNIDLILDAFSKTKLKLILVGNWNNSSYGKELRERFIDFNNLLLLDPIYDQIQLNELRSNCGIYVHGHSVGGTNPSLVEAMNLGLPCLVYDVDYNRVTTEDAALYFKNTSELIDLLNLYIKSPDQYLALGVKLKIIAKKRYRWDIIVNKYDSLFNS